MLIQLRTAENKTIAGVEIWESDGIIDVASSVDIFNYSEFLMGLYDKASPEKTYEFVEQIDSVSEMKQIVDNELFDERTNTKESYKEVVEYVRKILQLVAKQFNLYISED